MIPFALTLITSVFLLIAIVWLGNRRPGYRHAEHTISELGEVRAADGRLVSFGVFLPVGVALLLAAHLVRPADERAALLALCIAVGYAVAAFFPCDPGSPLWGSNRQMVHNLGGGVEYFGGAVALGRLAEVHGPVFTAAAFTVGAAGVALSLPSLKVRGLVQRVAEAVLFGGLLWALWRVV
ncbi:MAG TPA: DUF998 domain-containing protein [Thermoanaerobaculia bacterium]|nr:DUF998 domain-containing protein [Thermoanaerobaculia bacterium]